MCTVAAVLPNDLQLLGVSTEELQQETRCQRQAAALYSESQHGRTPRVHAIFQIFLVCLQRAACPCATDQL